MFKITFLMAGMGSVWLACEWEFVQPALYLSSFQALD